MASSSHNSSLIFGNNVATAMNTAAPSSAQLFTTKAASRLAIDSIRALARSKESAK